MKSNPPRLRKYRLEELLSKYTPEVKNNKISELADELDISIRQIRKYRYWPMDLKGGMNTDQLMVCAGFFGISVNEFLNNTLVHED